MARTRSCRAFEQFEASTAEPDQEEGSLKAACEKRLVRSDASGTGAIRSRLETRVRSNHRAIAVALEQIPTQDAQGWFWHGGYLSQKPDKGVSGAVPA